MKKSLVMVFLLVLPIVSAGFFNDFFGSENIFGSAVSDRECFGFIQGSRDLVVCVV